MPHCFLGIDVGGTKVHALIADDSGKALSYGIAGPGNPLTVGYGGMTKALHEASQQALSEAKISKENIASAGFGVAGYDWPSQQEAILGAIQSLELNVPVKVVNDAIIGLLAGAEEGWGLAIVAGTGANCRGWDKERREGRVTGFGSRMGEGTGATDLVADAIRAIAYEWTRRGPPTSLTQAFMKLTDAHNIDALIEGLSLKQIKLGAEAALVVFKVANEGDPVAMELIRLAGSELGSLAVDVIHQLGFEELNFDVVLVGSMYDGSPVLVETMRETIHSVAPGALLVRLSVPPVIGGVLLGMEQVGFQYSCIREALIRSTEKLMNRKFQTDAATSIIGE